MSILYYDQVQFRIYVFKALSKDITFRTAHGRVQGKKLTVLVGHGHVITVKDDQMADSCADYHFSSIATHSPDTDHGNGGGPEMVQHFLPDQH